MNNNHAKGKWNEIKGKVKEEVGHNTGDERMAGEGVADQIKGKIQKGFGDAKDSVKKVVDRFLQEERPTRRHG